MNIAVARKKLAASFKPFECTGGKKYTRWYKSLCIDNPSLASMFASRCMTADSRLSLAYEAFFLDNLCTECSSKYVCAKYHCICADCAQKDPRLIQTRISRGYSARDDRFEETHGVRYPQQLASIKETTRLSNKLNWGATHPMATPKGKRLHRDAVCASHGVVNVMQNPEVVRKQQANNLLKYGTACTLNTQTNIEKKKATWLANLGVSNPSHSLDIFRKKYKDACLTYKYKGKKYYVQGTSELAVLRRLLSRGYSVTTPFSKEYPVDTFDKTGGFPDLYLLDSSTYIEVKSTWTFSGLGKEYDHLQTNQLKATKYARKSVRWVVHGVDTKKRLLCYPA